MIILTVIVICAISYFLGCFSTARVFAKNFKHKNIYKIGSGLADTENIYTNISKPLGVMTALIDSGKIAVYLLLVKLLFIYFGYELSDAWMFLFGSFMIAGHCLPITHKFKGGRGIFSYMGLLIVFPPLWYILLGVVIIATILVFKFKQIRFSQYMIVLLPPIVGIFVLDDAHLVILMLITAFLMGLLNVILSKKLGEF